MENSYQQENSRVHQQPPFRSFSKIAAWGIMLLILQHIALSPLDRGQLQTHFYFQKPISTILTLPESPSEGHLPADAPQESPPEPTVLPQKGEHLFHAIIIKAAAEHEIDPALIKAIIMAESGYNPKAISKKGAAGLMQLMPRTAAALGVEDIFNPVHNINGGVLYFKRLVELFKGDVKLALAAYNAGAGKVRMYRGIPPFKATRYYIEKVFEYYEHYREQVIPDLKQT